MYPAIQHEQNKIAGYHQQIGSWNLIEDIEVLLWVEEGDLVVLVSKPATDIISSTGVPLFHIPQQ